MGYLNTQLEKSSLCCIEEGMEKKALTIADIVRMGNDAVRRGKALHFIKRLEQRNRALVNNKQPRLNRFYNTADKLDNASTLEYSYGIQGPNNKELQRLINRIPVNNPDIVNELTRVSPSTFPKIDHLDLHKIRTTPRAAVEYLLGTHHAQISADQLAKIVKNLRKGWGNELV